MISFHISMPTLAHNWNYRCAASQSHKQCCELMVSLKYFTSRNFDILSNFQSSLALLQRAQTYLWAAVKWWNNMKPMTGMCILGSWNYILYLNLHFGLIDFNSYLISIWLCVDTTPWCYSQYHSTMLVNRDDLWKVRKAQGQLSPGGLSVQQTDFFLLWDTTGMFEIYEIPLVYRNVTVRETSCVLNPQ